MGTIKVQLGKRSYPVVVTDNQPAAFWNKIRQLCERQSRVFLFFDANFYALHGNRFLSQAKKAKVSVDYWVLPSGERTKSQRHLQRIHDVLLSSKIERTDLVIAVGGGVTTDIVGYAASTVLRGVRWVAVPTTLLGMVDAAIGGKTGINHKEGKNLIGAFWQPSMVWSDSYFLQTLPKRQMVAGLGEVLKYAGIANPDMLKLLRNLLDGGDLNDNRSLNRLIDHSARIKAEIVADDETESGLRMILNYGHTVGHAVEKSLRYGRLLHGEAVILGIFSALELGRITGVENSGECDDYREIASGMMNSLPKRKLVCDNILKAMESDKKRRAGHQNYILLRAVGKPIIADTVSKATVRRAVATMIRQYEK